MNWAEWVEEEERNYDNSLVRGLIEAQHDECWDMVVDMAKSEEERSSNEEC